MSFTLYADDDNDPNAYKTSVRDLLARRGFAASVRNVQRLLGVEDKEGSVTKPKSTEITVGIVGAGCAGLYAAMILQDLGIKFELIEGSDRVGGRVRTHRFTPNGDHDYLDVGAMRFPRLWSMRRLTIHLFNKL